jgi:hypothetical protein
MTLRRLLGAFVALVVISVLAWSQAVNGSMVGTVTDSSGAVIPNAKVTILEVDTGSSRSTDTNDSGNYSFSDLPPGTYRVDLEAKGFKHEIRPRTDVLVNQTPRVDFQVQPGSVSDTIEVTAESPALQTDRADTSSQIEMTQTANLPVGTNRNFQSLLNLVPGTTPASFQHSQFFNAASSLQTEVNGQMRMGNSYQIEGVDDNERTGLLQILVPPIEAIRIVDVSTSNFEAELGRASGANANVVLKSGTNNLHGAVYEFMRNSALNARNFFDASVGHLAYNYIGGNAGGAIKKNKLFFFGDYLKIFDHEANSNTGTIPPTPWRTGDFSSASTVIYDPATGNPDGTNRTPFIGNIIPANRINSISAKIIGLVPNPNQQINNTTPSNNYFALLPFTKDTDSFDTKIDFNMSEKNRLSGRFSFARPVVFQAPIFGDVAGGFAQGAFQGQSIQKTYSTGINYNRVFSNTLIAEFRAGVAHYHNDAHPSDYGMKTAEELGIPGVNIDQWTSGIPSININGFSTPIVGYSASVPWSRAEVNASVSNTWTKSLGNHTIKWGADYRRIRDDLLQTQTVNPRGQYNFDVNQTSLNPAAGTSQPKTSAANNMASFLLDQASFAGRDLAAGYFPAIRGNELFLFAQDKWQASSKLTVDIGLRWELYSPFTPRFAGGFSNYNPTNNTLELAGVGNIPMNLGVEARYKNFAPRLGAAYRLNSKTVIRAGFGITYTPFPDNTYAYNYPVKQNKQYNSLNSFGVAVLDDGVTPATFQNGFPTPVYANIPSNGIITNPDPKQSDFVIPKNFKNPSVQSWNLAFGQALPGNFTLDVAYVGNHGVNSVVQYNLNLPTTVLGGGNNSRPMVAQFGRTADTTIFFVGASTHYNALQAKLNRRFSNGLGITTSYTFGKGMSYQTGDDGGLWTYTDQRRGYARTDFDRTHNFSQSYVYELPFGVGKKMLNQGVVARILGGWQVNGILSILSGTPLTFSANGGTLNTPGTPATADQVGPYQVLGGINTPARGGSAYFLQSSFVQPVYNPSPGVFRVGTSGRNITSGPGYYNLDASVFKVIPVKEQIRLEIRGEAFSVLNNPHWNNPETNVSSANYGYITGASGGRGMQLGVKFSF